MNTLPGAESSFCRMLYSFSVRLMLCPSSQTSCAKESSFSSSTESTLPLAAAPSDRRSSAATRFMSTEGLQGLVT